MVQNKSKNKSKEAVCKFFANGSCRFGDKCKYLHEVQVQSTSADNGRWGVASNAVLDEMPSPSVLSSSVLVTINGGTREPVKSIPRVAKPCRGWQAGSCKWGDKCRFQHGIRVTSSQNQDNISPAQFSPPVTTVTGFPDAEINAAQETPLAIAPIQVQRGANAAAASQGSGAIHRANGSVPHHTRKRQEAVRDTQRSDAVPRASEGTLRHSREQKAAAHREREEAARRQREEATRRQREEVARREREEAARREQEEVARREQEEAARREQEEAVRLVRERIAAALREEQQRLVREREERERIVQRQRQEAEWTREAAMTIQRVIMDSVVKVEAGLAIQHVICRFEASQIMIKNLPLDATASEIIELFSQQGIDEADIAIWRKDIVDGCQQVRILGKRTEVDIIALGLDGIEFRDKNLEFTVCQRLSGGRSMGSSSNSTYHLSISWRAPPLTMVAIYFGLNIRDIQAKVINLNNRELNGQRVRVEYNSTEIVFGDSQRSLQISRIPGGTSIADVQAFAEAPHVRILSGDMNVFQTIDTHLRSFPNSCLRSFALDDQPKPNLVSAKAIFDSWEGAKAVYDSLNSQPLRPNFPHLRLFLSDPYRFVITIEEKQYIAQRNQWVNLCDTKSREARVQTKTVPNRAKGNKVVLILLGNDKKAVGALKVRIESLARGQKLDASYWHPRLASEKGQRFFSDLSEQSGAYVRYDWKLRCVVAHGTAEATETAKSRIKDEVERLSAEEWTIPLQRRALGFFIREGLAKMKGLLGEENVTLNVPSAQIVLHGADLEEARHYLRQLMDAFANHNAGLTVQSSNDILCPICYDTLSQAVEVSCGHIYCSSCLRHYIHSALDNRSFPLKCMGNDATCNSPFSIPLIQRFLSPQRFEQLIEAAFVSYIERNPEVFKYCTTPDCTQVYRTATSPNELQCPSCFSDICTACHEEGHAGLTCAERRAQRDPVEQDRLNEAWALNNGVKRCPSCRVWLEKMEGCNHMTCQCGKHICWVCMGMFEADEIYVHMAEAHNGYYAPEPQRNEVRAAPGQLGNQVPDIVQLAGGPGAVAAQMAELRRIELQRVNRGVVFGAPPVADPRREDELMQQRALRARLDDQARARRQMELENERRELIRQARARRERQLENERREAIHRLETERQAAEVRRRQLFEQQVRRETKEKSWCIIM